jgi:hypothetical protein
VTNLPTAVQTALQTAQNQSTQGSSELVVIQVIIPSSQETQNIVDGGGLGGGTTPTAGPGGGTGGPPIGCADCAGPSPIPPQPPTTTPRSCGSPPCEE